MPFEVDLARALPPQSWVRKGPRHLVLHPSYEDMPVIRIGVFIAVYHGDEPDLFRRAIVSVLQQQFDEPVDLRIYLGIDGPLTIGLQTEVDELAHRFHRIVRSDTNRGLAATLNSLINVREKEKFYFRMDADDVSLPNRFQAQLDYFNNHPKVGILGTDIFEVDSVSNHRRVVHFCDSPSHAQTMIYRRVPVAHPSVCFRREVFDLVSGYPISKGNEDIAMWFDCMKVGILFDNVKEPLLEFRIGPDFWRRRSKEKAWQEFLAYYSGILHIWGFNWRLVFPFARFLFRLLPLPIVRAAYRMRAASRRS